MNDHFSEKIKHLFDKTVDIVFGIILVFIILAIAIGTVQLFLSVWKLVSFSGFGGKYITIITDVLTLYVLIELSRSLVEYFNTHRLRLTFIVDAAIVFIIRELLILLFKHTISNETLYALSALLLVLGGIRIGSILVFQREKQLSSDIHD